MGKLKMKRIIILSPAYIATGGTELLQQLCAELNMDNIYSEMYYTSVYKDSPVEEKFSEYNNPITTELVDDDDSIIVIPETLIDYAYSIKRAKIYIWWLSVDNYYGANRIKYDFIRNFVYRIKDKMNSKLFKKCDHLVQSEYARQYLLKEKNVQPSKIDSLSDYLNKEFLNENRSNGDRESIILYNPKKGIDFTMRIMEEVGEYEWVALEGMTTQEMKSLMCRSKLYIDFGNHPGKDRMPREAAVCGCCIITGKRGAASNDKDILIPDKYKFNDNIDEIHSIHKMITNCLENYDDNYINFNNYVEKIFNEEAIFKKEVKKIFS